MRVVLAGLQTLVTSRASRSCCHPAVSERCCAQEREREVGLREGERETEKKRERGRQRAREREREYGMQLG